MIVIPMTGRDSTTLIIVLEKDNAERIKQADPITLTSIKRGGVLDIKSALPNFEIVIAYEEDIAPIKAMADNNNLSGIIEHLFRGYKFIEGLDGPEHIVHIKSSS